MFLIFLVTSCTNHFCYNTKASSCENLSHHIEEMFSVATKTNELYQTNYLSLTDSRSIDFSNAVSWFRPFSPRGFLSNLMRESFSAQEEKEEVEEQSRIDGISRS